MTFPVPDFAFGDGRGFRITASQVAGRHSGFTCRMGLALSARQRVGRLQPNDQTRWRSQFDKASTLHFTLRDLTFEMASGGDVNAALAANTEITHAQRRFLRHALDQLQELIPAASDACGDEMALDEEVRRDFTMDEMPGEVTVFGRHFRNSSGSIHEIARMRLKQLRPLRVSDTDWTAVAATTLGYTPGVPETARIRVSEFSLDNGEYRTVFDGSRADAVALYEQQGRPLREALHGGAFSPGAACSGCAFLNVCPAVPQRRGVLGIPGRSVATRHITSADLHAYDRCPTAFLAQRRDHLPDAYMNDDESPSEVARQRGLAVHAWLAWAHSRTPPRGCTTSDLPSPDSPEAEAATTEAELDPESYRLAHPYLLQHLDHCPCGLDGLGGWVTERRRVVFDPDADVVVISSPDLTCTVEGNDAPIWRETKTSNSVPADLEDALHRYPAFALNICLLISGLRDPNASAFAELEVLTPTDGEVFYVSANDGETIAAAQKIVASIVRRYADDLSFDRKPNAGCQTCSAHGWCDPPLTPRAVAAQAPVVDDDEFADVPDPF